MANGTRNPSGVVENTTFIGLAAAIGAALASDVQSPEWRYVILVGAPLAGKYAQMIVAALIGETLKDTLSRGRNALLALFAAMGLGLAGAPAHAQDAQTPTVGCGGGTCSIYFLDVSWPPAVGVNAVEFARFRVGAGLSGGYELGQVSPLGGVCLIPRVGPTLGPLCPGS